MAVLGYLKPSARFDGAVVKLREALRAKTGAAVTFGYGPRFQHSTGQMHKGGPPVGRFLQLVHDEGDDLDIPARRTRSGRSSTRPRPATCRPCVTTGCRPSA